MATTDARPVPKKNTAFRHYFRIWKTDGSLLEEAWTGTASTRSLDGGSESATTNNVVQVGSTSRGYLELTTTEMNTDSTGLKITVTNTDAVPVVVELYPEDGNDIRVGVTHWNNVALSTTNPLPNAAADAAGGLPISDAGSLDLDAILVDTNELQTNQGNWLTATTVNLNADQSGVTIGTVTTLTGHTAQTGDTYALANGATGFAAIAGFLDTEIAAILEDTGTSLPALIAGPVTLADGAHGGASASITLSDYSDFQGAAGSDPWGTALPGAYAAGTAGYIVGTNLDSQISGVGGAIGPGSTLRTLLIQKDGNPVDGAAVWITTDEAGLNTIAGTRYSDGVGIVTFMLDAGTYYVWKQLAGVNFTNPETYVAS